MRVIHWFRNDLRLADNTALVAAAERASQLLPVFIFDPELQQQHRSSKRLAFLEGCLAKLAADLEARGCPLVVLDGEPAATLGRLIEESRAELVTFNRDYSPYANRRDAAVIRRVEKAGARVETFKDRVVFESEEVLTKSGTPFRIFTPYRNAWTRKLRAAPAQPSKTVRLPTHLPAPAGCVLHKQPIQGSDRLEVGEAAAAARLERFLEQSVASYAEGRDRPGRDGTSRLSPALRFGTISIRTCVAAVLERGGSRSKTATGATKWLDELIWRDFYVAILAQHPHVLRRAFRDEYRDIEWNDDEKGFRAWCQGRTGYPIVDAGMRQLVETGWMHNRARMIVASFLVKDLLIDWRRGESFFMKHLIDGDPASNNGGWQWAASTGTDAQPYFRIFNPVSQGKKYDPDGQYVRKWVPELIDLPDRYLHAPWLAKTPPSGYPEPIVDHAERRIAAITRFSAAKQSSDSSKPG